MLSSRQPFSGLRPIHRQLPLHSLILCWYRHVQWRLYNKKGRLDTFLDDHRLQFHPGASLVNLFAKGESYHFEMSWVISSDNPSKATFLHAFVLVPF